MNPRYIYAISIVIGIMLNFLLQTSFYYSIDGASDLDTLITTVIYSSIFFADRVKNKIPQIFFSLLTSILIWFILASPFAIYKFSNILIGIIGFLIIITITHLILKSKNYELGLVRPKYTKTQMLIRALFTGSIIATVVLLGKTLNPFWGGIFTMFPAATFATLIILHFYYAPKQLFYFMKNAPLGSISLFIYAISIMLLFPKLGIWTGTLISYCISLTFGLLLIIYKLRQHKRIEEKARTANTQLFKLGRSLSTYISKKS